MESDQKILIEIARANEAFFLGCDTAPVGVNPGVFDHVVKQWLSDPDALAEARSANQLVLA